MNTTKYYHVVVVLLFTLFCLNMYSQNSNEQTKSLPVSAPSGNATGTSSPAPSQGSQSTAALDDWLLVGNSITGSEFMGTTSANDLVFKSHGFFAGRLNN